MTLIVEIPEPLAIRAFSADAPIDELGRLVRDELVKRYVIVRNGERGLKLHL